MFVVRVFSHSAQCVSWRIPPRGKTAAPRSLGLHPVHSATPPSGWMILWAYSYRPRHSQITPGGTPALPTLIVLHYGVMGV